MLIHKANQPALSHLSLAIVLRIAFNSGSRYAFFKSPSYDQIAVFKTPCLFLLLLLLCGCVIVPRTTEIYNSDCMFIAKQSELKPVYVAALGGCKDEQCAGLLVFAGAVTAVSAVISGSIVVVENVVYWLEKQKQCDEVSNP